MIESIFHGVSTSPIAISDLSRSESDTSWDGLKQTYLIDVSGNLNAALDFHYPYGQVKSSLYPGMFISRRDPRDQGGGIYEIEVEWKGVINSKGFRRVVKVFGETSSTSNGFYINAPGYPSWVKKIKLEQPVLSVETTYVAGSLPSMSQVKQEISGHPAGFPGLPTPPAQFITSFSDPTYVYPSGWILDDRSTEQLPNTTYHMVTDRHVFKFKKEM